MNRVKKHISLLLLAVFSLAVLPAPALHKWFADHTDVAENHCRFYHKDLGCHIEDQQTHCDIFKTLTPLYDAVKVQPSFQLFAVAANDRPLGIVCARPFSPPALLPSRGPPAA